jgi:drug/metabolite transporter (DMT)-like permease
MDVPGGPRRHEGIKRMNLHKRLSIKALAVVVFWGVSFVATRIALEVMTPLALVATRMVIGCAIMFALARLMGLRIWPQGRDQTRCVLLGVILAVHLVIQAVGLLKTTAINTGWIIAFAPIALAVGALVFLRERLRARAWGGILLGTTGVLIVSLSTGVRFTDAKVGDLLQLISCVTWAAYTLLAVRAITRSGSLPVTFAAVGVAAVATTLVALARPWVVSPLDLQTVLAVIFLGVVCTGSAHWLWNAAVREVGSTTAGAYLYLEPIVTWITAAAVLGERINAVGLLGGAMVLLGVWIVSTARR